MSGGITMVMASMEAFLRNGAVKRGHRSITNVYMNNVAKTKVVHVLQG
eukprot:COSAG01_NODE_502_length_16182_cov_24.914257_14_plen_48_part_00